MTRLQRDEAGQIGGVEALIFGVLIFVFGTLVVVNAWGVVDAKFVTSTAAREAVRTFVEARTASAAADGAQAAAYEAMGTRPRDRIGVELVEGTFERCSRVTMQVSYRVPFIRVPVLGGFGSAFAVASRHTELVDPYRNGVGTGREAACGIPG